jgi:EmrB/QacA subfamily drug resistance transporter
MEDKTKKRITLFIVTMAAFLTPFDGSSVNIALPTIGNEFAMDAVSLGWVSTAYLLASAVFLVPFGRFADIYGRKKIFASGILIFTLASMAMTLCTTSTMLISFRIIQGIGSAMIFGTGIALLSSVYPVQERGKVLGISVSATYLGLSLGPYLGGLLTMHFGWRSIFFVNVPIGLVALILIFSKLKGEWAEARGEKFDLTGSILYSIGIIATMLGFSAFSRLGKTTSIGLMLTGVLFLLIFMKYETRIEHPVVNINLFIRNRAFAFSNLAALINYSATFAITFFLSLYLQYIKKLDPESAGAILVCQPIVMALASPFMGRLSDRIEPRLVASIGMAITSIGLFLLVYLNEDTSTLFIILVLILIGMGFALFSSPNSNAVMSSVEKKYYGVASGTLGTMRLTGQAFSMGIATLIFAIHIGHAQITSEYYPAFLTSMKTAFIFSGIVCAFGILASLSRGNVRKDQSGSL